MRTANSNTLFYSTKLSDQMTTTAKTATTTTFTPPATIQRSPWHSPVPYLFGGLAAMLGLIAFALLILACSYWKLSGQVNGENDGDVESGSAEKIENGSDAKSMPIFEEKFLVIMAGDMNPTFLATPVYNSKAANSSFNNDTKENEKEEKLKQKDEPVLQLNQEEAEQSHLNQEQNQ
ncbi:hypothetical protein ACJIZ3_001711 [Penstemon smallii]|uniref:Uncharacterized protein n=1 Tax=Penstemon smallii TaxID=265156 RepID=A0ABD3U800_9LAMI